MISFSYFISSNLGAFLFSLFPRQQRTPPPPFVQIVQTAQKPAILSRHNLSVHRFKLYALTYYLQRKVKRRFAKAPAAKYAGQTHLECCKPLETNKPILNPVRFRTSGEHKGRLAGRSYDVLTRPRVWQSAPSPTAFQTAQI
jgi:hypothetical protein